MYLNQKERKERLDNLNNFPKDLENSFMFCKSCDGTGLGGLTKLNSIGTISWDGITYCDHCKGWGKIEWIEFIKKGFIVDNFYIGKKKQNNGRNI